MQSVEALELGRQAVTTGLLAVAPVLLAGLLTGMVISLLLAATQIQEFTLTFIPKILMMAVAALLFGPWMLRTVMTFAIEVFSRLPQVGH
jgi:flagellar biosynthetic protein FliQ